MTPLVLDASAIVDLLLRSPQGELVRPHLTEADLHTVAHLDAEVFSAFARLHRARTVSAEDVTVRLRLLMTFAIQRMPITRALLEDAWALRDNVAARDALYVALARRLRARLLTTDGRLARAVPGIVVPLPPHEL